MYRGNAPPGGPPPAGSGRGQHLLKPAWMTQGLQPSSQPAAPQAQTTTAPPPLSAAQGAYSYASQQHGVPGQLSSSYPGQTRPPMSTGALPQASPYPPQQSQAPQQQGGYAQGMQMMGRPASQPIPVLNRPPQTVIPVVTHWVEAKTPEGRTFYSNTLTGASTFDKPFEMKTPAERALPTCVWKAFCKDGRLYYVNSETQASVWEEPMEYTKFKLRLKSHCAGEAPTKDQLSMAVYQAARKALDELVIDLDGSYAKMKAAEEAAAAADEEANKNRATISANTADFVQIHGELERPDERPAKTSQFETKGKEVFLQMLEDWNIPPNATWEETFATGIASDPRYASLPSLTSKKSAVSERRANALSSSLAGTEADRSKQRGDFEIYLNELEARQILGPRSTFAALLPLIKYEKKLPSGVTESDVKLWFDAQVESIAKRTQREREAEDQVVERIVHDALSKIDKSEQLTKQDLFEHLMKTNFTSEHPEMKPEQIRRYCGTYAQRTAERREALIKESEAQLREALFTGLRRAFFEGAISIDARWTEFKADDDLRATRAPYLVELMLPLAGHESLVEKEFRNAREEARDAVSDVGRRLREAGWNVPSMKRIADFTDAKALEELKQLEERYGRGIVEKALSEQARRFSKDKERFFELLAKYVREPREAVWDRVKVLISDRTAYNDMGSDAARKQAFDEFVATLDTRRRSSSRGRSRSPEGRDSRRRRG